MSFIYLIQKYFCHFYAESQAVNRNFSFWLDSTSNQSEWTTLEADTLIPLGHLS